MEMKYTPHFKSAHTTNNATAEMYWECLRRRVDYIHFATDHLQLQIDHLNIIQQGGAASPQAKEIKEKHDSMLYKANARWGIGDILPPTKSFSALTAAQKRALYIIIGGFKEIALHQENLDTKERWNIFVMAGQRGYILPPNFEVKIIPMKRQFAPADKSRQRADLKQFRAEMKAWDMKKAGKSWSFIGEKLAILKDTTLTNKISLARRFHKAAWKKITKCIDWRQIAT